VIATLRGEISQMEENAIIVETGNVGLRVFTTKTLREKLNIGDGIFLFTHLVIREDDWKLFGFEIQADRELFSLLLGVDGVGPRTALSLLSSKSNEEIKNAIRNNEPQLLSQVAGVGVKTAQKIILTLHDKVKPGEGMERLIGISESDSQVLAALVALGYSVVEAQNALQAIPKNTSDDIEERLRLTLQQLGR
jgi:Holliday junction DNA helicase RuvA